MAHPRRALAFILAASLVVFHGLALADSQAKQMHTQRVVVDTVNRSLVDSLSRSIGLRALACLADGTTCPP